MDALDREFNEMCDGAAERLGGRPAPSYAPSSPFGTMAPQVFSPAEEARLREEFTRQLIEGKLIDTPWAGRYRLGREPGSTS